jgi:polar amino acid transport system substrate-binding protein
VEAIKREREVKIVTFPVNAPFSFGQGFGVQGFDVDIGEEIAKALGVKVKWVKANTFESMFDLVKNEEVHMAISSISITPEREQQGFAFSKPYYDAGLTVAFRKDAKGIKSFNDLKGKKVGVHEHTTGEAYVVKSGLDVKLEKYKSLEDALQAVNAKEIDAVVGDEPIISYNIYKTYKQLTKLEKNLTDEKYGVLLKQRPNNELLNVANQTIDKMKSTDQYSALVKKWFGEYEAEIKRKKEEAAAQQARAGRPKTVHIRISSNGSGISLGDLDGYQITLQGSGRSYTSGHLNSGQSQVSNVPPGSYTLILPKLRLSAGVTIPPSEAGSVTVNIRLGRGGSASVTVS